MISLTVGWIIAFFFANLLQCIPLATNWNGLGTTAGACIDTNQMYLGQAWSDVITDSRLLEVCLS